MKSRNVILSVALFSTLFFFYNKSAYATHDDFVVGSVETTGAARGPAIQIYDKFTRALRLTVFVLNANFTDFHVVQDVRNGGANHERILVCGRETSGANRGPAFQLFERDGTLITTRFALNTDFTSLDCDSKDLDGDGLHEILMVGNETTGAARGWFVQIFDQAGTLQATVPLLNGDFRNSPLFIETGRGGD